MDGRYRLIVMGVAVRRWFLDMTRVGVLRRSYWALALPVTAATVGALYISLWIGRALMTTPSEPTDY